MQVNSISNYSYSPQQVSFSSKQNKQKKSSSVPSLSEDNLRSASKSMRNAALGLLMLPIAGATITSCDDGYAWAKAGTEIIPDSTSVGDTIKNDTIVKTDTITKTDTLLVDNNVYLYQRPMVLDSLYKNFKNWKIEGTADDANDPLANRNIYHYEGVRDWEYGTKEIGDLKLLESSENIGVFNTEILDYKGNHKAYGKRIHRIPESDFTLVKKDGTELHSPKGWFVDEYISYSDKKDPSIYDCAFVSRAFLQTNGEELKVARLKGTSNRYVETGTVSQGYLGDNTILLHDLIGEYSTDDHIIDFKVEAVPDDKLKEMYIDEITTASK